MYVSIPDLCTLTYFDFCQTLEGRIDACEDVSSKEKYNVIKVTANAMIEAIKHSIVMLQISKVST